MKKKRIAEFPSKCGDDIIFNMPKTIAENLVDEKHPASKVMTQEYLCEYVNDQMHCLGDCVKVNLV